MLKLSRGARVGVALAALGLLGLVALLAGVLLSLEGTRSELRTTRARVSLVDERFGALDRGLRPVLEAATALTSASGRRAAGRVGEAAAAVPPLAQDVHTVAGTVGAVAGDTDAAARDTGAIRADTRTAARVTSAIARTLDDADLGTALRAVRSLVDAVAGDGRFVRLAGTVQAVRGLLGSQRRLTARTVRIQLELLGIGRETDARLGQSLDLQRDLLAHVTSIDRKLPSLTPSAAGSSPTAARP